MSTFGKVIDATVIVGTVGVGVGAAKTIISGVKSRKTGIVILGAFTGLICIYAFKEAIRKINE